jgi:hypothetical protein
LLIAERALATSARSIVSHRLVAQGADEQTLEFWRELVAEEFLPEEQDDDDDVSDL